MIGIKLSESVLELDIVCRIKGRHNHVGHPRVSNKLINYAKFDDHIKSSLHSDLNLMHYKKGPLDLSSLSFKYGL